MKKWKIACIVLAVLLAGVTAAYAATAAAAGSQGDPLVTLSYLQSVFRPQVEKMAEDTAKGYETEFQDALNGAGGAQTGDSSFAVVTLSRGQTITGRVGCELMLRVGSATASGGSPALIDTTAGSTLSSGGALVTNHLYMVTIEPRTVTATAGTVKLLVRGPYTVG